MRYLIYGRKSGAPFFLLFSSLRLLLHCHRSSSFFFRLLHPIFVALFREFKTSWTVCFMSLPLYFLCSNRMNFLACKLVPRDVNAIAGRWPVWCFFGRGELGRGHGWQQQVSLKTLEIICFRVLKHFVGDSADQVFTTYDAVSLFYLSQKHETELAGSFNDPDFKVTALAKRGAGHWD